MSVATGGVGMIVYGWEIQKLGEPLVPQEWVIDPPASDEVVVRVAGCAACETDVEIARGEAPRHPESLPLGHEIAGTVVASGDEAADWLGRSVIVPPVPPPGVFGRCWHRPGNWDHGAASREPARVHSGFASHIVVPARGLCLVDDDELRDYEIDLADLSVLAEAVGTPYQAIVQSRLQEADVAVFIGAGEPGLFGVQIAVLLGAHVVALDRDDERLERALHFGAGLALNIAGKDPPAVRQAVNDHLRARGRQRTPLKLFEMTGTTAGHLVARELVGPGSFLALVGRSRADVSIRLHEVATFVATVQGFCHCMSEQMPETLELVLANDVDLEPLIVRQPMSRINETLDQLSRGMAGRPVLIPDFPT